MCVLSHEMPPASLLPPLLGCPWLNVVADLTILYF